jgi:dTDP-D-glucose 4,6-dehydratase
LSVKLLQRNKKIRLHNEGKPIRNWLHADDSAEAVIAVIQSSAKNEIYNIAGNCEQSNRLTVEKIISNYFKTSILSYDEYLDLSYARQGQDVRYALNDQKLKLLGWKPKKNFDDEIQNLVEYYRKNFKW